MKKILLPALLLFSSVALGQRGQVRDKIEEDNYKKHGEPGIEKYNEWMQGKVLNAKVAEQYLFPLSMTMEMTGYKNGKKREPVRTKYYINSTTANFATKIEDEKKREQMLMVYDMKANSMLMLDQVKMTGMAININAFMSGEAIANREKNMQNGTGKSDHDCKKTGKTKTILGYHCEEYICTDEKKNTRSEIWLSPKVAINMAASMRGPMAGYAGGWSHMAGMMMEANFYKNDQLESSLLVTELNESANMKVVTADYKLNGY